MLETQSYRTILKVRLADRITANPAYSLRAMAANVKLSPSLLSEVLKGKKNLSVESALQVARGLKFSTHETEVFALLVQLESTKSPELKASLLERLNALQPQAKVHDLNLDVFRSISEWYHLAILEMTQIKDMQLTADKAAKALGISVHEASAALERLIRLELLEKDEQGVLRKTTNLILATAKVPNQALRTYHEQTMKKAIASLQEQTPQEKFVGSETFAFDEQSLKEAAEVIEECFSKVIRIAAKAKKRKSVYHMGIQLFRLTKKEKPS